jgi:phosphoribosylformylglycinamidine synthase subunit PurSL
LDIGNRHLASAITDLGGGGLSSGVCEVAKSFGCGADVNLASIPLKTAHIQPWEIWISESQERMLLVIPEESVAKALSIFEREEIEACAFGTLTKTGKIALRNRDEQLGTLSLDFLFSPPLPALVARRLSKARNGKTVSQNVKKTKSDNLGHDLISLLGSPNIASKESFVRTYDFEIKGNTILKPYQYPGSGPNDAAVLKPVQGSEKGLVISCGYSPLLSTIDNYWMAATSIDEAVRNNVAAGGRRIALLDNFAWGDVHDSRTLGGLVEAARACYDVSRAYEMPFISGKDSLYNETPLGEILPTLVITAIGILPNISRTLSADFKTDGNSIYLVGKMMPELGGSEYFRLKNVKGGEVPKLDLEKAPYLYRAMNRVSDLPFVKAVHDLSQGGLAVALAEMCFANSLGADVRLPVTDPVMSPDELLFSESNSRFLVEVLEDENPKFEKVLKGFPFSRIGTVVKDRITISDSEKELLKLGTAECASAWKNAFRLHHTADFGHN